MSQRLRLLLLLLLLRALKKHHMPCSQKARFRK